MSTPKEPGSESAWEALTEGRLTRDEEAVLRALADENEDDAVRLEAYAPLGDDFAERMTARLGTLASAQVGGGAASEGDAPESAREAPRPSNVRRLFTIGGPMLAAAAAAVLLWMPVGSSLPPYTLEVQGADAELRGSPQADGVARVSENTVLTLVAKPAERVRTTVAVTVLALALGRVALVEADVKAAPTGAMRVRVAARDLPFPEADDLTLAVVLSQSPLGLEEAQDLVLDEDPRALTIEVTRRPQR